MSEKIVQIQLSSGDGEDTTDILYALTDEGRVFIGEWKPHPDDKDLDPEKEPTKPPIFRWDLDVLPVLPNIPVAQGHRHE